MNLSNFLQLAMMKLLGIGLDIYATIVAEMDVGIDYGIYLLSPIHEEFGARTGDWDEAITAALTTTGKAIMFTASIMLLAIAPRYFPSDLKFMADMGMLPVAIMLINMVLSPVLLPLLVWVVKPDFMSRGGSAGGEPGFVDLRGEPSFRRVRLRPQHHVARRPAPEGASINFAPQDLPVVRADGTDRDRRLDVSGAALPLLATTIMAGGKC